MEANKPQGAFPCLEAEVYEYDVGLDSVVPSYLPALFALGAVAFLLHFV